MKKLKTSSEGHIMALICVLVWGSSFMVSKELMNFFPPVQVMLFRFTLAYISLWIIHPRRYFNFKEEWRFLLMAIFANTLYCWSENTAITYTQTTNVSIIVTTSPIISALILPLFYKQEKLTGKKASGFIISFLGVILVVLNGTLTLKLQPVGDFLALVAAASWAVYGILLKKWSDFYDSMLITRKLMFYGMITTIPLVMLHGAPINFTALLTLENILRLCYLGIICGAACYVLWSKAVKRIGVLNSNLYIYMIPLIALLAGSIILKEQITFMGIIGIILVLSGMIYATLSNK